MAISRSAPRELWERLQSDAGLELHLKGGKYGRDADLERAVLAELVKHAKPAVAVGTVDALLKVDQEAQPSRVTTETLLVAVLTSQRGFGAMMEDILKTLIDAQAQVAERPLSIEFDLDAVDGPIRQTLEQFRARVERVIEVLETTGYELPNFDQRWALWNALRDVAMYDAEMRNRDFPPAETRRTTGHALVDARLAEIDDIIGIFQSQCLRFGTDRPRVVEAGRARFTDWQDAAQEPERRLISDASDYWDSDVRSSVRKIASATRHGRVNADEVASQLEQALSRVPRRQEWINRTYQEALEILNLPAWRKRHELYSVWVGTALLRTAHRCADEFRFHPVRGVLSFSFAGHRMATYVHDAAQFDIWCELRSALAGPSKKRKRGIQPDFRVVEASIAQDASAATRLVLECKHYLAYSLSNFRAAATDYARGCPNADVFLVNHGPADHELLIEGIDAGLASKISFRGDVTAATRVRPHPLERDLERVLFPTRAASANDLCAANVGPAKPLVLAAPGSVRLEWTAELDDLDLALYVLDRDGGLIDRIDFAHKSGQYHPPIAHLKEDVMSGPGTEVIQIGTWDHAIYALTVTNYRGMGRMTPSNTVCTLLVDGREHRLVPPPGGVEGKIWDVMRIDAQARRLVE